MMDKDSEIRRLGKLKTSLWVILLINVATCIGNSTFTYCVLALDGIVFALMLQQVRRDIGDLEVKLPDPKPRSTKPKETGMI